MWVPLFRDDDEWSSYKKELYEWIGTPYKHLKMAKGRGADCSLFIAATWLFAGVISEVVYDYYPKDWHIHTLDEFVLNGLYWHLKNKGCAGYDVIRVDYKDQSSFIRGDVLAFTTTPRNVTNHAAVWIGFNSVTKEKNKMLNSIMPKGVCELQYGTWWQSRLTSIFRIMRSV